ncbi:MAG: type II toxin-antitoxin system VapC family toxin [Chthoniobacterales bacterium]
MILADTSLWIAHLRVGHGGFKALLDRKHISVHWVVLGELATGNLPQRAGFLATLALIPKAKTGSPEECLALVENYKLYGRGLGWSDVQLLVAARLSGNPLWTLDTRLATTAAELGVAYEPA